MHDKAPNKVTKVLVNKIHGGRKQDSKFWQSEFANQDLSYNVDIPKPKFLKRKRSLLSTSTFIFLFLSIFALVAFKPDIFPFLDRAWIHQNTVQKYYDWRNQSGTPEILVAEPYPQNHSFQENGSTSASKEKQVEKYITKKNLRSRENLQTGRSQKKVILNHLPVYTYSYKGNDGVFRTLETKEVLNSRIVNGQPYYYGMTEKAKTLANFLNENHGVNLE